MLALLLACARPTDDSAAPPAPDSPGDTEAETPIPGCHAAAAPAGIPELHTVENEADYRIVRLQSDALDELYAIVAFSGDGETAYDEGAPVVVTAPPSLDLSAKWREAPATDFPREWGVIEVLPLYPGWTTLDRTTSGAPDAGGPLDEAAVFDTVRFAAGIVPSYDGWTLAELVASPVCDDQVLFLATSSGGTPALGMLRDHVEELSPHLLGFATYELPMLPQLLVTDAGMVWMDADTEADDDGDGVGWDDGRNHSFDDTSCTVDGCAVDLSALRWSTEHRVADVWLTGPDDSQPYGVFYLDRDGSGRLDVDAEGSPDIDGDGAIEATEDAVLIPHLVADDRGDLHVYSPEVIAAAQGTFDTWPAHVATLDVTTTFWAARSPAPDTRTMAAAWAGGLRASILYGAVPHAVPWPSGPALRMLYDELDAAGAVTRYNMAIEPARCLLRADELADWQGGPPVGTALAADEIVAWSFPPETSSRRVIPAGALGQIWDTWGPFDRCPEGA